MVPQDQTNKPIHYTIIYHILSLSIFLPFLPDIFSKHNTTVTFAHIAFNSHLVWLHISLVTCKTWSPCTECSTWCLPLELFLASQQHCKLAAPGRILERSCNTAIIWMAFHQHRINPEKSLLTLWIPVIKIYNQCLLQ